MKKGIHQLRPYQQDIKRRVVAAWDSHRSVMVQMPTGTGKTHVLAAIIREVADEGVWIIAHRRELVEQIEETVARYGMRTAGGRVRVMSIQWLSRHWDDMDGRRPGVIVIDEAHHALAATYKELWSRHPEARKLGMTATPCRLNRMGFTDLFEVLIASDGIADFIRQGWLSAFDYVSIRPDSEDQRLVDSLSKRGADGDFQVKEMNAVLNRKPEIGRLYEALRQFADGKKGIVYAVSIDHARHIADYYRQQGISAEAIDSRTPPLTRKQLVEDFKQGKIQVLVNVDVFSEGFDCPDVEFVQLARPTLSLAKYLQQVGRGLRRTDGKEACMLIDNVGLYRLFGLPTIPRDWTAMFEGRLAGKGRTDRNIGTSAYMAMPSERTAMPGEDSRLEWVVSHADLLECLETGTHLHEKESIRNQDKLKPFKKDGLWGLRRGQTITAMAQYSEVFDVEDGLAAVRFEDYQTGIVDESGNIRLKSGCHRRMKFLEGHIVAASGKHPDIYIDLKNGKQYLEKPHVVRFGAIEMLKVGRAFFSRTTHAYQSCPDLNRLDFVARDFYLRIYDHRSPAFAHKYVDGMDSFIHRECVCILANDATDFYYFCGHLADGSIVVVDGKGLYYLVEEGREKRFVARENPATEEEDFCVVMPRLEAEARFRAEQARKANRRKQEQKRQERLAGLQHAVPFRSGTKWGLKLGDRIIVPPIYHSIQTPVGIYCAVETNPRQWGIIMLDGQVVVEARYMNVKISDNGTASLTIIPGKTRIVHLKA